MTTFIKMFYFALLAIIMLTLFGCGSGGSGSKNKDTNKISVTNVLNLYELYVTVGGTCTVPENNIVIVPSNATNKTIIWSPDNPSIATIDQTGTITGKSVGKTRICATSEDNSNIKGWCDLTVTDKDIGGFIIGVN